MRKWVINLTMALAVSWFALTGVSQDVPVLVTATPQVPLGKWVDIQVVQPQDATGSLVRVNKISIGLDQEVTTTDSSPNLLKLNDGKYAFTYWIPGEFVVEAVVLSAEKMHVAQATFIIGKGDVPKPDVDNVPFPSEGLRVLIIEETGERATLPGGQQQILLSTHVRGWLKKNTVEKDGFRIWDDDYDAEDGEQDFINDTWKQAYLVAKKDSDGVLPWLVAANGDKGFSGPLPGTPDELIMILEKLK